MRVAINSSEIDESNAAILPKAQENERPTAVAHTPDKDTIGARRTHLTSPCADATLATARALHTT